MTIDTAFQSAVFLTYLKIIGGLLVFAGVMITILRVSGKIGQRFTYHAFIDRCGHQGVKASCVSIPNRKIKRFQNCLGPLPKI